MPDFSDCGESTAPALQFACSHFQQLPESFKQLQDLLGSNSLAAVWVACMLQVRAALCSNLHAGCAKCDRLALKNSVSSDAVLQRCGAPLGAVVHP
jgi:hypothetical protein